jgi:hypothetical protein
VSIHTHISRHGDTADYDHVDTAQDFLMFTKRLARDSLAGIAVHGAADPTAGGDDAQPGDGQFTRPRPDREISTADSPAMRPHCVELPVLGEPVRSNSPRQVGASHRSETGAAFCPSGSDHRAASARFHAYAKTVRALAARL